jgi:hypothetical protein
MPHAAYDMHHACAACRLRWNITTHQTA